MSAVDEAEKVLNKARAADEYEARALEGADGNILAADTKIEKARAQVDAAEQAKATAISERNDVADRAAAAKAAHDQAQAAYDEAVQAAGGVTAQAGVASVGVEGEGN